MEIPIVDTWAGRLAVKIDDCWVRNHTIHGNIYEEHIILGPLKKFLETSKYILDIGGNNGGHTLAFSQLSPHDAHIYTFEPQKEMCEYINLNIKLNSLQEKVTVYNNCVGDENKLVELSSVETKKTDQGYSLASVGIGEGGEKCEMITIDSLELPGCDFMKIDVEGAESVTLLGAKNTIQKYKPVITFEHNGQNVKCSDGSYKTPFEVLVSFGYKKFQYLDWSNYITWHSSVDFDLDPCLKTNFF